MEIYNERMEWIENPNLELGWLEERVRMVHHPAIEAVEERWHYETTAEYPNGGRDVRRVIDVKGVEAKDAWDESIPIQIYRLYTDEELEERAQAAKRPTLEERITELEAAIVLLRDTFDAAAQQWAEVLAEKGAE